MADSAFRAALPLLVFAVVATSAAWASFGERGILANQALRHEVAAREARLAEREEAISHLRREIERMKTDPSLQERWVREELGYVRPGELVYLFPGDRTADFDFLKDRQLLRPTFTLLTPPPAP
jgi:cell division protein FtsB